MAWKIKIMKSINRRRIVALIKTRCKKCDRLLFKGAIKTIEIKCPKCGYIQTFVSSPQKTLDIGLGKSKVTQHTV